MGRTRKVKVTKLRPGERLMVEITTDKTGVVVVKAPAGGTVRLKKSSPGLKETANVP